MRREIFDPLGTTCLMKGGVLQALRNLRAFGRAYGALLIDLLAACRNRVALVFALSIAGIVLQVAALAVALLYVSGLTATEGGSAINVPVLSSLDLPVDASPTGIAAWGSAILAIVICAAGATYGAEVIGFQTARRYLNARGEQMLASVSRATEAPRGARPGETPTRQVQRLLGRNESMVLRALLLLQRSLRAFLMVAIAAVVLMVLNPTLTGIVAAVGMIFAIPYYLVNRRLVEAATLLEDVGSRAGRSVRQIVEAATTRESHETTADVAPRLYRQDAAIEQRWASISEVLLARQRASALLTALFGVSFVAILVAFSVFIAEGSASWAVALTFLLALNVASAAFVELGTSITAANRFLPRVQEYIAFVTGVAATPSTVPSRTTAAHPLPVVRATNPSLPGSLTLMSLDSERVHCVCPERVDRLNLRLWLSRLAGGDADDGRRLAEAAYFCGDFAALPPVPLRTILQIPADGEASQRAFSALLARFDLTSEFDALPAGFETVLDDVTERRLSAEMRFLLALAPGMIRQSRIFIIGWKVLGPVSRANRMRFLVALGPVPVLLLGTRTGQSQPPETTRTIILGADGVQGMGDAGWHSDIAARLVADEQEARVTTITPADEELLEA